MDWAEGGSELLKMNLFIAYIIKQNTLKNKIFKLVRESYKDCNSKLKKHKETKGTDWSFNPLTQHLINVCTFPNGIFIVAIQSPFRS